MLFFCLWLDVNGRDNHGDYFKLCRDSEIEIEGADNPAFPASIPFLFLTSSKLQEFSFFFFLFPALCSATTPYNFSWWHCILFTVVNTPKPPNMRSPPPGLLRLITTYGSLKGLTQPRKIRGHHGHNSTAASAAGALTNHRNTHLAEGPSDRPGSSTGSGKWIKRPG